MLVVDGMTGCTGLGTGVGSAFANNFGDSGLGMVMPKLAGGGTLSNRSGDEILEMTGGGGGTGVMSEGMVFILIESGGVLSFNNSELKKN